MNTRFSIIVPVYNTTIELLDRCLKSIEKCEMDNYEIIIVNDGSNEDITEKIESFVKNRKKIKYIFKENGGVSSARNVGIRNSSGDYVIFVDADDTVFDLYLASADKLIKKYSPDLIIGKIVFEKIENVQEINEEYYFSSEKMGIIKEAFLIGTNHNDKKLAIPGSPCARVYKKSIAESIMFAENVRYYEDQLFNLNFIFAAESAVVCPENWYMYRYNGNSAMNKNIKKSVVANSIPFFDKLVDIYKEKRLVDYEKSFLKYCKNFITNSVLMSMQYGSRVTEKNDIKMLDDLELYTITVDGLSYKDFGGLTNKIKYYLYKNKKFKRYLFLKELLRKRK